MAGPRADPGMFQSVDPALRERPWGWHGPSGGTGHSAVPAWRHGRYRDRAPCGDTPYAAVWRMSRYDPCDDVIPHGPGGGGMSGMPVALSGAHPAAASCAERQVAPVGPVPGGNTACGVKRKGRLAYGGSKRPIPGTAKNDNLLSPQARLSISGLPGSRGLTAKTAGGAGARMGAPKADGRPGPTGRHQNSGGNGDMPARGAAGNARRPVPMGRLRPEGRPVPRGRLEDRFKILFSGMGGMPVEDIPRRVKYVKSSVGAVTAAMLDGKAGRGDILPTVEITEKAYAVSLCRARQYGLVAEDRRLTQRGRWCGIAFKLGVSLSGLCVLADMYVIRCLLWPRDVRCHEKNEMVEKKLGLLPNGMMDVYGSLMRKEYICCRKGHNHKRVPRVAYLNDAVFAWLHGYMRDMIAMREALL